MCCVFGAVRLVGSSAALETVGCVKKSGLTDLQPVINWVLSKYYINIILTLEKREYMSETHYSELVGELFLLVPYRKSSTIF